MAKPLLVITLKHQHEGKYKLKINSALFLAWNIGNRTTHIDWQQANVTMTDAADLAYYVARFDGKTTCKDKNDWIRNIETLTAKFKKGFLA